MGKSEKLVKDCLKFQYKKSNCSIFLLKVGRQFENTSKFILLCKFRFTKMRSALEYLSCSWLNLKVTRLSSEISLKCFLVKKSFPIFHGVFSYQLVLITLVLFLHLVLSLFPRMGFLFLSRSITMLIHYLRIGWAW